MRFIYIALALALVMVGCGPSGWKYGPSYIVGSYGPTHCFKNLAADSSGGTYTIASLSFNQDGTGSNDFELFSDSACTVSTYSGTLSTTYTIPRFVPLNSLRNNLYIFHIDQGSNGSFYLPIMFTAYGLFVDVNGVSPYKTEPTDAELAHLLPNPLLSSGVIFVPRK